MMVTLYAARLLLFLVVAVVIVIAIVPTTELHTRSSKSLLSITSTTTNTIAAPRLTRLSPNLGQDGDDDSNGDGDYIRPDDRLSRRDFTWTTARGETQNLCGDSTFVAVDSNSNSSSDDPLMEDCVMFVNYAGSRDGFWLVTDFGDDGADWVEFVRLQSCRMAVRHSDGGNGTIPIGNQDVIDLLNSVMALYPGREALPTTEGTMTCIRDAASAGVHWKVFNA